MKKIKSVFFCLSMLSLVITGCGKVIRSVSSNNYSGDQLYAIYELAVADGYNGTYQEWIESIKGADGKDGETPYIKDGYWYVGDTNTNVKAQGEQGPQGIQGPQGEKGEKGDPGEKGETGSQGPAGSQGPQGPQGSQGHQGPAGNQGPQGSQGPQGEKGDTGENGKTAYEIYKEAHPDYSKSEDEWLDDLINGRLGNRDVHEVTFDSNGGSAVASQEILHGEKIVEPSDPTRNGYTFEGWTYNGNPWVFYGYVVSENMTLTANWEAIDYTVTFKNEDGTVLEIQDEIHYGDSVTYHGLTPISTTLCPIDHYVYSFDGWDVDISNITGDTIAVAQYTAVYAPDIANYYDENDNFICSVYVGEGEVPVYPGELPTKVDDESLKLQYSFSEWEEVSNVDHIITYKPLFDSCTLGLSFQEDTVKKYEGDSINVVVPNRWNGYDITKVGNNSFKETAVKSVELPLGIQTIGQSAFLQCEALTTINIPSTVTTIGRFAFWRCHSLSSITLPNGITEIDEYVFAECRSLSSIVIPAGVTEIKARAFSDCKFSSIIIPDGVAIIGVCAFYCCSRLKSVIIPMSVETMGAWAFDTCINSTLLVENESKPINWDENWNESTLNGDRPFTVWGYKSTKTVGDYTYALAEVNNDKQASLIGLDDSVESFEVPEFVDDYKVIAIDDRLICQKENLTEVTWPSYQTSIPYYQFSDCTNLTTIVIPSGVTTIEDGAFNGCTKLRNITLPNTITSIGDHAFNNCDNLLSINIPSSVEIIGKYAFSSCDNLESVSIYPINSSLETIDDYAFYGCRSLVSFTVPLSTTYIGKGAFYSCYSLETVDLHGECTEIFEEAFMNCTSLTSVTIPNDVNFIGARAFYNCKKLEIVNLNTMLASIGESAFEKCDILETIDIPEGVVIMGSNVFKDCPLLTIRCEASSKPIAWEDDWNPDSRPTIWDYA